MRCLSSHKATFLGLTTWSSAPTQRTGEAEPWASFVATDHAVRGTGVATLIHFALTLASRSDPEKIGGRKARSDGALITRFHAIRDASEAESAPRLGGVAET